MILSYNKSFISHFSWTWRRWCKQMNPRAPTPSKHHIIYIYILHLRTEFLFLHRTDFCFPDGIMHCLFKCWQSNKEVKTQSHSAYNTQTLANANLQNFQISNNKTAVIWDTMPCTLVEIYHVSEKTLAFIFIVCFHPEGGGSMLLWNSTFPPNNKESHTKSQQSSQSPVQEPEILHGLSKDCKLVTNFNFSFLGTAVWTSNTPHV